MPHWRGLIILILTLGAIVAAIGFAPASLAQTARHKAQDRHIMFDASGRQLEDPRDSAAARRQRGATEPSETPVRGLGRAAIGNAKIGFETETKVKSDRLPDGRVVPGMDQNMREGDPRFLGLSLTLPNSWAKPPR